MKSGIGVGVALVASAWLGYRIGFKVTTWSARMHLNELIEHWGGALAAETERFLNKE